MRSGEPERRRALLDTTKAVRVRDLCASAIQAALGDMHTNGTSLQTCQHYMRAVKQFARWLHRNGRCRDNALEHLGGFNVQTDRRRERRAMNGDELRRLIVEAHDGPTWRGMTGPDRAMLYRVAAGSGFRRGELRSLTTASFSLDAVPPSITLRAGDAKSRRDTVQPIRSDLADALALWLDDKADDAPVFDAMPARTCEMLRRDLRRAKAVWIRETQDRKERRQRRDSDFLSVENSAGHVADFHGLRGELHHGAGEGRRIGEGSPNACPALGPEIDPEHLHPARRERPDRGAGRSAGPHAAGLSVLMRYTLRLLTLDQLSRAATLICALELLRQDQADKLGDWPFEIGLWVGKAATPNRMGKKGDNDSESARAKTIAFRNDDRKPAPIPLEECPWCGEKFRAASFQLLPGPDFPTDLRINCVNRRCNFSRGQPLPILAVDEPIYRRLPCFMIATVDKFAAMPWTGEVGGFFGRVQRYDQNGFYGPCDPRTGQPLPAGRLMPPDLVIQDELHLISGPLGTLVGLYETALDGLCSYERDGHQFGPKIVASTATVRRADSQIRALFNRRTVDIFPPPGPDRRDSFFAEVHPPSRSNARLYVGVAA